MLTFDEIFKEPHFQNMFRVRLWFYVFCTNKDHMNINTIL